MGNCDNTERGFLETKDLIHITVTYEKIEQAGLLIRKER